MIPEETLKRYINHLDKVIEDGDATAAKELQHEILAALGADLNGLKKGLTSYSPVVVFGNVQTGGTLGTGRAPDYLKDAQILRSRLMVELDKVRAGDDGMRGMLGSHPKEKLLLRKGNGDTFEAEALVDGGTVFSEDVSIDIEEGDVFVRTIPNGTREYYRVMRRGIFDSDGGIRELYQIKAKKVSHDAAEHALAEALDDLEPRKLFVSHSSRDKDYMSAFVEMLEDIGMPEGSIVCTSVPGYGIPGGTNIFDWLRDQFLTCNLRVVFALSENYYSSAACLNEMGAAWVTKATDTLLLLPGFGFGDIQGCVDSRNMGISFETDEEELRHRLNEFKDVLIKEHHLQPITATRWERHRDRFISRVREIAASSREITFESSNGFRPVVGRQDVGNIPIEPAFLLVYAAAGDGQILRIETLSSPTQITVSGKQFAEDMSQRESARWQEALDMLISWGWVKGVGNKGQVFELTGTGYRNADWLKDGMGIDTSRDPLEELKDFE